MLGVQALDTSTNTCHIPANLQYINISYTIDCKWFGQMKMDHSHRQDIESSFCVSFIQVMSPHMYGVNCCMWHQHERRDSASYMKSLNMDMKMLNLHMMILQHSKEVVMCNLRSYMQSYKPEWTTHCTHVSGPDEEPPRQHNCSMILMCFISNTF